MATFQPGQSGNPGGRRKADPGIVALAKSKGQAAIGVLAEIALNKRVSAIARVKAATALLDRGYGRPVQEVRGEVTMDEESLTALEQARRLAFEAELIARQIEKDRPDLGRVDRKMVARKLIEQVTHEVEKEKRNGKAANR